MSDETLPLIRLGVESPIVVEGRWVVRLDGVVDDDVDLRAMLEQAGLRTGDVHEYSAVTDAAIAFGVFVHANGLDQLAAVLHEYVSRNQHKKVEYYPNGRVRSVEGMSKREHRRVLEEAKVEQDRRLAAAMKSRRTSGS